MASILLENVSVDIPIFNASNRSLKNNVISAATGGQIRPRDGGKLSIRALSDLSLRLDHGARLGLVGHNGAGKSTMLRLMAGIYEPTGGRVEIHGQVASMFDVSFGMDPESTGWDNIVLRGMLLGYSKRDIRAKMAEIGAASELGEFLDMPIRTYSAGMATRLAFAISTSITPEILLVDEGIGAGDAAFIAQARERMKRFIGDAGILVLASHQDELIREWCTHALWMEHGSPRMYGEAGEILEAYAASVAAPA